MISTTHNASPQPYGEPPATETAEATVFRLAEYLQSEAKSLQFRASEMYRGAAKIKAAILAKSTAAEGVTANG